MATDYRIAAGSSVALGSLYVFGSGSPPSMPQPTSEGIKATRRDYSSDGTEIIEQGLYVELVWSVLKDKTMVQAIFAQCGLSSANIAAVTVYCRNDLYDYHRYNGIAVRPLPTWSQSRPRNVVLLVRDLEFID